MQSGMHGYPIALDRKWAFFDTPGPILFSVPHGVLRLWARLVAAGGGGGGTNIGSSNIASGGSAGARIDWEFSVYAGMVIPGFVGEKGLGGIGDTNGSPGGDTKFGGIICPGGPGGIKNTGIAPAKVAAATFVAFEHMIFPPINAFEQYSLAGGPGTASTVSGIGARSPLLLDDTGDTPGVTVAGPGNPATRYGGGGSGAFGYAGAGQDGGHGYRGMILLRW